MSLKTHSYLVDLIKARRAVLGLAAQPEVDDALARHLRSYFIAGEEADSAWNEDNYQKLVRHLTTKAQAIGLDSPFVYDPHRQAADAGGEPQLERTFLLAFLNPVVDRCLAIDLPADLANPDQAYRDRVYDIIDGELSPKSPLAPRLRAVPGRGASVAGLFRAAPPVDNDDSLKLDLSQNLPDELIAHTKQFIREQSTAEKGGKITGPGETIFVGGLRMISILNNAKNLADIGIDTTKDKSAIGPVSSIAQTVISAGLFLMYIAEWIYGYYHECQKSNKPLSLSTLVGLFPYIKSKLTPDDTKEFLLGAAYFALGVIGLAVFASGFSITFVFAAMGLFDAAWDLGRNLHKRVALSRAIAANNAEIVRLDGEIQARIAESESLHRELQAAKQLPASAETVATITRIRANLGTCKDQYDTLVSQKKTAQLKDIEYEIDAYRSRSTFATFRHVARIVLATAAIVGAVVFVFFPPAGTIILAVTAFCSAALFIAHTIHRQRMAEHINKKDWLKQHQKYPLHLAENNQGRSLSNNAVVNAQLGQLPAADLPPVPPVPPVSPVLSVPPGNGAPVRLFMLDDDNQPLMTDTATDNPTAAPLAAASLQ